MSPIYSILVFVCIFNAIKAEPEVAKTPSERDLGLQVAEECGIANGISKDEIQTFFTRQKLPETEKGEGFILCYLDKTGIVVADKFQWDVLKHQLDAHFGIGQENLKRIEKTCRNEDDSTALNPGEVIAIAKCIELEIQNLIKTMRGKLFEAEIAAASTCGDINKFSRDEVIAFLKEHKFPEGKSKLEFVACYASATGLISSERTFNWEGMKAKLAIMKQMNMDKLDKIQETCKDAEDFGKEEKQRFFDIADCVRRELLKTDEKQSDSSESSEEGDSS